MLQNSAIWIYYPILFLILDKYFVCIKNIRKCILILGKKNGVVENITPKKTFYFSYFQMPIERLYSGLVW